MLYDIKVSIYWSIMELKSHTASSQIHIGYMKTDVKSVMGSGHDARSLIFSQYLYYLEVTTGSPYVPISSRRNQSLFYINYTVLLRINQTLILRIHPIVLLLY